MKTLHLELDISHVENLADLAELVRQVGHRLRSVAPTDLGPTVQHQAFDARMRLVGVWQIREKR